MSIGVLMPVEKETEKGRAGKTSTVYKCIMVKCNLDTEVEDKDIRIKVAYNTQSKQSKGNDKRAVYKHYRTQHEYRHIHQCTFDGCSIDGHPFGNDKQYMVWWHMQEDHGLCSPLGCPKCDGTFCAKQTQQKHIAICPGKKAKSGPYGEKNTLVMSVLKSTPQRLHSKITKRFTRVQIKNKCAASVAKL